MIAASGKFGRMVLGLPQSAVDYPAVEAAAALAESLGLPCVGAYIVEPAMSGLGAAPGARELRSVTAGWQPIESAVLAREIQDAADAARRTFANVAAKLSVATDFHLARGATAEILSSLVGENDIVAMIEPRHPADRITRQFLDFAEAVFDASFAVMLLPHRIARKQGPIAAIASGPEDPMIDTAADLARSMHESLIVVGAHGERISKPTLLERYAGSRVAGGRWRGLSAEDQVAEGLAGLQERLIVVRRTMLDRAQARALAAKRQVPVLVTGRC